MDKEIRRVADLSRFEHGPAFAKIMTFIATYSKAIESVSFSEFHHEPSPVIVRHEAASL
jgi:hypothetical protein